MTVSGLLSPTGTERLGPEDIRLLSEWNAVCPTPVNSCIHDLVHDVCLSQPQAIAISAVDGEWTYAEIDSVSTSLARKLIINHGVQPGVFVPICIEKSCWTVIGMLAVLKAGGAFLMLDPSHPPDRLLGVCRDISATLVLTSVFCIQLALTLAEKSLVIADSISVEDSDDRMNPVTPPQSPMYAVFTSGSTGKPKGGVVSHSAFTSMATSVLPSTGLGPQSRVLQFSSNAFDGIILDHFLTLLAGGCVCIPSETESKNRVSEFINRLEINWAFLTPSVARILSPEKIPTMQHLALGGEALAQSDIDLWSGHVQLIELYGPAECAALSTINPDIAKANSPTNIGYPIAIKCWVVDQHDHNKLVAIGEEGELLLEGPGLGGGYINRPEQTAAAYLEAPEWLAMDRREQPGNGRMYKTGDLVRFNRDGSLQYLGRKDMQVKLHGQRIELGEIESNVRECCTVAEDAVAEVVRRNNREGLHLCLFLYCPLGDEAMHKTSSESETLFEQPTAWFQDQIQGLLSQLRERLPQYMVPEYVISITHVPMTKTGKTDRQRLRAEAAVALEQAIAHRSDGPASNNIPWTAKEKKLQELWSKTLSIPRESIRIGDNWFHLGANSISTMRLVANASEENLLFTVQDVFRHPVLTDLAGLARYVTSCGGMIEPFALLDEDATVREAVIRKVIDQYPNSPESVEDIYPCTTNQVQCIQMSLEKAANLTLHIDLDVVPGSVDPGRFAQAWKCLLEAHPILRTHIIEVDQGNYYQVVRRETLPIEFSSSLPSTDTDIWGFGQPLIRLMRRDNGFTILFHHTTHDGFSVALVLQQLEKAYHGDTLQFQPFSPFIKWISQIDQRVHEFWKNMFAGWRQEVFPKLPYPKYKPQGAAYLKTSITATCQKTQHRFMIDTKLRLALALALARATGDRDVVFGTHVNRRDVPLPGVTQMTGPTIGTFPVRVKFKDQHQTLEDQLKAIQDQTLDTIMFQCAELDYIKRLSSETASACEFQTSLMIQPDLGDMTSNLFSKCHYREAQFACWSLGFVAEIHSPALDLYAFYDEQMIQASQVQSMLDLMTKVLELIEQAPDRPVGDLLEN